MISGTHIDVVEREAKQQTLEELEKKAEKLSRKVRHIPDEEVAKHIREDRDTR